MLFSIYRQLTFLAYSVPLRSHSILKTGMVQAKFMALCVPYLNDLKTCKISTWCSALLPKAVEVQSSSLLLSAEY